jgi:hypothetical protein
VAKAVDKAADKPRRLNRRTFLMKLRKHEGGTSVMYRGAAYTWENDGDVTGVPDGLAADLLPLGGYEAVPDGKPAEDPPFDTGNPVSNPDDSDDDGDPPKAVASKGRTKTA